MEAASVAAAWAAEVKAVVAVVATAMAMVAEDLVVAETLAMAVAPICKKKQNKQIVKIVNERSCDAHECGRGFE